MKFTKYFVVLIFLPSLILFAQTKDSENKTNDEKILELERNLKKQQQDLEELKKTMGKSNSDISESEDSENYVSPLKKNGLTGRYNRGMFLDPDQAPLFNKNQKPWLNDWIRVGAFVKPRSENRYNYGFNKQNKSVVSRVVQSAQLFLLFDPSPYFTMKISFQDARLWGGSTAASSGDDRRFTFAGSGNAVTPGTSANIPSNTFVREAWFMLKKLPLGAELQVGRQVIAYGDQRIIGGANWTMNGLSFDGMRLMFNKQHFDIHLFAYKTVSYANAANGLYSAHAPVTYTDPNTLRTSTVNPGTPDQYMVGTYNTIKAKDYFNLELYGVGILNSRTPSYSGAVLTNPALVIPATPDSDLYTNQWSKQQNNLLTGGFRLTNRTSNNKLPSSSPYSGWDWTFESAWQGGETGLKVIENADKNLLYNRILATATGQSSTNYNLNRENQRYTGQLHVAQTGYTFFQKLRIGTQILYSSGDSRRGDGSESTFQTLSMPRFGVIPYWNNVAGLSENIDMKNLISKNVNLSYKTDKFGTFYFNYIVNLKAQTQDAWYAISGLANTGSTVEFYKGQTNFALTSSNRRIYDEIDFTWMYNVNDYVSLWIGGGLMTAGNSIKNQKNAILTYDASTGAISYNTKVILGQEGAASKANMFFVQLNAAF